MKLISRFSIVLAVLFAFVSWSRADDLDSLLANVQSIAQKRVAIPRRASIIYIQFHGLARGDLSCYGQTNFQTPNIDKLAAEGIRFENYDAGNATNLSGQVALLTGKNSGGGATVAQLLKNAGYTTAFYGEWNLIAPPWTQGFDEFAGFLSPDEERNYYSDFMWRQAPGTVFDQAAGREPIYENQGGKHGVSTTDFFFKMAANYIRDNHPGRANKHRPFFLMLNLSAPRSAKAGADVFPVPSDAPYSEEAWPQAAKNRAALLTRLDGDISVLREQLQKYRMTNNVVIFLSSSAAPKFADKKLDFFHGKNELKHPDHWRAPLIVNWPDFIAPGQVCETNCTPADFLPTAAEIGFTKPSKKIDGHSLLPVLVGKKERDFH